MMHTRIYRGYQFGWGRPGSLEVYIGTADGDYITTAADEDDAERTVDEWLDAP